MTPHWQTLRDDKPLYGCFVSTGNAINTELMAAAGFDYVVIDLEHGMGAERDVLAQVQALSGTATTPIVRVESHERPRVHRLLDLGVQGIMFPRVDTAAQAAACIANMRYQPKGERGVAVLVRASNWGKDFAAYSAATETSLLSIIQIESAAAVANVEEIAAVDGADVLFVGPMDLTTSLGIFRQYDHPLFLDALEKTVAACRRHNRAAGILVPAAADTARYRQLGFTFLMCGTDTAFLLNGARAVNDGMRSA